MKFSHYSDIGKRELNEDYVAYSAQVFALCDGVGGETKGEIVSRIVADKFVEYIEEKSAETITQSSIQKVLERIQLEINNRLILYPEENGMGTTLASVIYSNQKLFLIHVGDSRIYFIRPSESTFWKTTDHSVVADLIFAGIITEAESRTHPMRNRITRAIQANSAGRLVRADIELIPEVRPGDLVFACSDGVLEGIQEPHILEILCSVEISVEERIDKIKKACQNKSIDNNTAFLIEFGSEETYSIPVDSNQEYLCKDSYIRFENESTTEFSKKNSDEPGINDLSNSENEIKSQGISLFSVAIASLLILIIASFTFSFCQRKKNSKDRNQTIQLPNNPEEVNS